MIKTLHLLIVEDNPGDVDLIREALPETGPFQFHIESVPRLAEALAWIAVGGIDVVLTDLGLPDSHGIETYRKLRKAAPNLAIIMLSGNDNQDLAVAAVGEGAQDFLVKGQLGGGLLMRAIRYAIERLSAEQARKQFEEALRKSEERYSITLTAVDEGLWDWDIPSGNAMFSPRYYTILGYDDGEFSASYSTWRKLVHSEDLDRVEKDLQRGVETDKGFAIDLRMKMKSGEWLWVSTRGKAIEKDAEGKALRMVGTLNDITERKQAEDALQKSEHKLDTMLQTMVEGMVTVDIAGQITYTNPAAERILGIGKNVLGKFYQSREWRQIDINGEPYPQDQLPLAIVLREQRIVSNAEHAIESPEGERKWLSVNAAPLFDDAGKLFGGIASFSEITERVFADLASKKAEAELRRAFDQIKTLRGIVPICANCKKIRDDKGYWNQVEVYVRDHTEAEFSHGICPECAKKLYPKFVHNGEGTE